ncbi:MAG TPA: hypothetical protein DD670_13105 [Planctomycetaceae bacterium]|nr:hypothetical protein [Planctomycetaceae bacterium]
MKKWLLLVVAATVAVIGCENREKSLAKQAGEQLGETVMDFGSGVGSAIDTKLTVPVELSDNVSEKGLSNTTAKTLLDVSPDNKGFAAYLIATTPVTGRLLAKALNQDGQEIGRAVVDVKFEPDDAMYVSFVFPKEMDSALVAKYVIDFREPKPARDDSTNDEKQLDLDK